MNLGELRTLLQLNLSDPNGDIFNTERCRILINAAYRHCYNKILADGESFVKEDQDVIFSVNTQEAAFTSSVQRIFVVRDSDGCIIPLRDEINAISSLTPCVYKKNQSLGWFTLPLSTFTVTVTSAPPVSQFSSTANDNTEINDIPAEYQDIVITWATLLALGKDEQAVNYWQNIFDQQFMAMMSQLKPHLAVGHSVADVDY